MKQLQTIKITTLILTALFFFVGCSDKDDTIISTPDKGTVDFSYTLTAAHSQKIETRAAVNVIATMTITNESTNSSEVIPWHVSLDEEQHTIYSNMTHVLSPSTYSFSLDVKKGNSRYIGTALNIIVSDASQLVIPLRVQPVIGDNNLEVTVKNIPVLKFQYPVDELAALTLPKLGYTIDDGTETVVILNKSTGLSEARLNVSEGAHKVSLKLYDDNIQVGKSKVEQENVTVSLNDNITMDIIPLSGEIQVTIPVDKGTGTFNIKVPHEIVTEAGSLENLKTVLQISGPNNTGLEQLVTLTDNGNGIFSGTAIFSAVSYDIVNITITFIDKAKNEVLATALYENVTLSANGVNLSAQVNLIRRALIGGNLLATTGVNVFDVDGNPVSGASVYLDDKLVGITGSAWGTEGYLKFHSIKGSYTLKAESGTMSGDTAVTLLALGIKNYILTIDDNFQFAEVQTIPTANMFDWESFTIGSESFVSVTNYQQGTGASNYNINSAVYRWNSNGVLQHFQNIPTNCGTGMEYFEIDGKSYLSVSNSYNGNTRNISSNIYVWNGSQFAVHQNIPTSGAFDAANFSIDGEHFLAVANNFNGSSNDIDSKIYKWNRSTEKFEDFQNIPTQGAFEWEYFNIGNEHFIGVSNIHNSAKSYRLNSDIYKWNGVQFELFQEIPTHGGIGMTFFSMNSNDYLAVVNYGEAAGTAANTVIYLWNGSRFIESQSIPTIGGSAADFITVNGDHYLSISQASLSNYNLGSKVYKWENGSFALFQNIPTIHSLGLQFIEYNNSVYLAAANSRTASDYTHNSIIYKWQN